MTEEFDFTLLEVITGDEAWEIVSSTLEGVLPEDQLRDGMRIRDYHDLAIGRLNITHVVDPSVFGFGFGFADVDGVLHNAHPGQLLAFADYKNAAVEAELEAAGQPFWYGGHDRWFIQALPKGETENLTPALFIGSHQEAPGIVETIFFGFE